MRRTLSAALVLGFACLVARADDEKKRGTTPEDTFNAIRECMMEGKAEEVWGFFSKSSHKYLAKQMGAMRPMLEAAGEEQKAEAAKEMGMTVEEMDKLTDEEFAKKAMSMQLKKMSEDEDEKKKLKETKWKSCDEKDGKAVCVTLEPDGKEDTVVMVKEDGVWKFDIESTEKLKSGDEGDDEEDEEEEEEEEEGSDK